MTPFRLDVDGKPCIIDLRELPARNQPNYIPLSHAQYKQADGFFITCAITEPSAVEHTRDALAEIRKAIEAVSERKHSSSDAVILPSKDPMRDVAFAVIATKWDLENERGHPSYALQNIATPLRKPCIEVSVKANVNVRLAMETLVRMMRVKHNKGAIKASKSTENLLSLGTTQMTFGNFWKRKLKFKQVDWHEYWRFCDINPTAIDLSSKQVSEVMRAVILNEPGAIAAAIASMKAQQSAQRTLSDPAASSPATTLFDMYPALHVAAIIGRVECAIELLEADTSSSVSVKDAHGKTALFRAARNGQLRMLPTLLKWASKSDTTVLEALRVALAPAILQHYDVEGLTTIFTEIVRCGFDLEGISKELQDLHSFLSKTAGALAGTTGNNSMVFHIAKAIAAIKLARQEPGATGLSAGTSSGSAAGAGTAKLALGMISGSKSSDKLPSPRKVKESPRKREFDAAKELGLQPDSFEPKRRTTSVDGGFRLRGYFTELAQSLQSTTAPVLNPDLQIRVIEQIAEAVGTSSPATRFEVTKLVAQTLVQSLVQTTSRTHTYGIIRLMNSLILDNDRASSLFGAEGAIAPLIATMVSSASEQQPPAPIRDSTEIAVQNDSWNTQTAAATSLFFIASCYSKNKEQVTNANGISAILMILGESFRGREKLFQSVLKLLATLVSNPGIAMIFCDSKQHPESLSIILSLIRNNDRPFLLRRYALKVVAELSRHEDLHEKLTSAGCDSNLFIVVLNSAKTNGLINDSLTPAIVACITRFSVSDSWAVRHGLVILPTLIECLQGVTSRKITLLANAADLWRTYSQIDTAKPILQAAITKPGTTVRWTLAPSADLQDAANIGLGDFGLDLKLTQQVDALCAQLQSTSLEQAIKAANQLADIVNREGPSAKRAILERNGFASLWKLLLQNRIHWQGSWLAKIDPDMLEFKERIGSGAFGSVYSGIYTFTGPKRKESVPVAIKTIEEEQLQLDDFKSELITLSLLSGVVKNVVEFKGYSFFTQTQTGKISTTKTYHCVVMELMETTLDKMIFHSKKKIKIKKMKRIAYDIAKGMSELHHFNILHRDLKPANILLNLKSSSMSVKIADLGYARRDTADSIRKSVVGTPTYLAPELFLDLRGKSLEVTKAADIYSYGILLYELVTRKKALDGIDAARIAVMMHEARQQGPRPTLLFPMDDVDSTLRSIILTCLSFDPLARPSFEKICNVLEADLAAQQ